MSSSLLPKYSFWLEKECLSREIKFVTVPQILRYLPGRFFKTRLHQLKPTALPCCEHGKYSTMGTLLAPSLCDCPIFLSPIAKHLHPALCLPAGFPPSLVCSIAQASAKCLQPSLSAVGRFEGEIGHCAAHSFHPGFSQTSCVSTGPHHPPPSAGEPRRADTQCPLPLGPNWG